MFPRSWILAWLVLASIDNAGAETADQRPFTSRDAAEMAYFGNLATSTLANSYDDGAACPSGQYALKVTHRGVLPEGVTEGTIWLFSVDDVARSINDPDLSPSVPVALARVSARVNGYPNDFVDHGNTVLRPRWSDDCKSVYFLGRDGQENRQLLNVEVESGKMTALTPRDRDVFAYSVSGPRAIMLLGDGFDAEERWSIEGPGIEDITMGTGQALNPLLFPNFREYSNVEPLTLEVWKMESGKAEPIIDGSTGLPLSVTTKSSAVDMSTVYEGAAKLESKDLDWTGFTEATEGGVPRISLSVEESLNQQPVLVALDNETGASRVVFDPNPQLAEVELLPVETFTWEDQHGREIRGGLLKPAHFDSTKRYPLVIQTHGFEPDRFFRVGYSETANAGRALASRGIVVLQVQEPDAWEETPINLDKAGLDVYVAAIDALASAGIIDPEKVGISGYSLTGLTVASSISRAPDRFAAAVIANADPLTLSAYYSYVDSPLQGLTEDLFVGEPPIGDGIEQWRQKSPSFSTDSIDAAVLVSAADPFHLLSLWDFYAALRYQGKPVELQFIRSGAHNLTQPLHRVAHQELIVDWFDFWLNGNENSESIEMVQFRKWRAMRDGD